MLADGEHKISIRGKEYIRGTRAIREGPTLIGSVDSDYNMPLL